jgi:glycosyltransferase involved in cell wall biosynthesis
MEDGIDISRGIHVREQPKVSIIMPAYNTAQFIAEALQSVGAQTYSDFEAIVINDGSPDTEELERAIAPYRDRIIYIKQTNRRAAGARNTGIRHSCGEYLAFLDSDDLLTPDALAVQMRKFEEDPLVDMICGDALLVDEASQSRRTCMEVFPSHGAVTFESLVTQETQISIVCAVVRKAVIETAGFFDESLRSWDDYDMWLRIAHAGGRISYHRAVVGSSRVGRSGSLGASGLALRESVMKLLSGLDRKLTLSDEQKALVLRRIAFHQAHQNRVMAKVYLHQGDYENAAASLAKANSYFKSRKLTLALLVLRSSPKLARIISNTRELN